MYESTLATQIYNTLMGVEGEHATEYFDKMYIVDCVVDPTNAKINLTYQDYEGAKKHNFELRIYKV